MTKNPLVAIIFRVLVIVTAVCAIICFATFMKAGIAGEDLSDDEAYQIIGQITKFYNIATVTAVASLVLSVITRANCHIISVFGRTFVMAIGTIMLFVSFKTNSIIKAAADIVDEFGSLDRVTIDDLDITSEKLREIQSLSPDELGVWLISVIIATLIFTILSFTSIHYLVKKKDKAA